MNMIYAFWLSACTVLTFFGSFRSEAAENGSGRLLDPLVPFNARMTGRENAAAELKAIREKTGLRRFLVTGPGFNSVMYAPFSDDVYPSIGDDIAAIARDLKGTDIRLSWWCSPSIRYVSGFAPIEDAWGNKSVDNKKCPLDGKFADDWAAKVRSVVERCRPEFVVIEDDYTLSWGRGLKASGACYCQRHMELFAKIYGRPLAPAEIWGAYTNRTSANLPVRQAFAETIKRSLVMLAERIRAEVDKVDPCVRILLCESGGEIDGDSTEAVARAFAGSTRPAIRPFGAVYSAETTPAAIPAAVAHAFSTVERLPRDIETFFEADTYPHNRFFSSASFMTSLMTGVMMAGSTDFMYYCTQYLDDPLEDDGYAMAYKALRPRLEKVRAFILENEAALSGVRIVAHPEQVCLVRRGATDGERGVTVLRGLAYMFSKFGIPYTTRADDASLAAIVGSVPDELSDDELKNLLSGGVFLDAQAAELVAKRGFASLIGADVERVEKIPALGEKLLPASGCAARGKRMLASFIFNAGAEGSSRRFVQLRPHAGAETLSVYLDGQGDPIAPSLTYFENRLGGRVAILPVAACGNRTSSLYNFRKQELMRRVFNRLSGEGGIDVVAANAPGIWTLANVSKDGRKMLVMANNLSGDDRNSVAFELGKTWQGSRVGRLRGDGSLHALGTVDGRFVSDVTLGIMKPEFFVFEKREDGCVPGL